MAFDKDTPEVKAWMRDYHAGTISAETASRMDVGGTGGEFGNITEEECEEEYNSMLIEAINAGLEENGGVLEFPKLKHDFKLRIDQEGWQTGIRAQLESAGVEECMIAQITGAMPTTEDINVTGCV